MCDTADGARVPRSAPPVFYRLSTAQIPNAMVAMAPPKLKSRMGPSPPVQRGPHHIPHLLGVPSARPGALRTPEALALFLEKHARAFVLAMTTSERVW